MKVLAWLAGIVTLLLALGYTVVSLARWEWNRALFFGMVFLAAEIGLGVALVLRRLPQDRSRPLGADGASSPRDDRGPSPALRALHDTRGEEPRFKWLEHDPQQVVGNTNVFITMFVGGGLVLSAGAWVLDKVASRTADPAREARLGSQLDRIAYRPGLVVDEVAALARREPHEEEPAVAAFLRSSDRPDAGP